MKPEKVAVILTDKKNSNRIFHVMVGEENNIQKYIKRNDPQINYTIVPNWDLVCEAVKIVKSNFK